MKILRLTRHPMVPEQKTELARIFGDTEIVEVDERVPDVERVKQLVADHGADVLDAILPLKLIADLTHPKSGFSTPVIRAVTRREELAGAEPLFHFSHYEKYIRVEIVVERL